MAALTAGLRTRRRCWIAVAVVVAIAVVSVKVGVPTEERSTLRSLAMDSRRLVAILASPLTVASDKPTNLSETMLVKGTRGVLGVGTGAVGVNVGSGVGTGFFDGLLVG